jgi:hypothetical protein
VPRRITPLTWGLLAFTLANALLVDLALERAAGGSRVLTTLHYTAALARGVAIDDSWRPMRAALAHLDGGSAEPLYRELFFARGTKFQYPPTSLLPLAALRAGFGERALSDAGLNALARGAAALFAALVAWLLWRTARESPRTAAAGRLDAALRAACVLALAATFHPLVRGLYLGQLQTFVDLLFAGVLLAWLAGRRATAGALAGLACALKPTLGLLALWGLVRGHVRFTAALAGSVLALALASGLRDGFAHQLDYVRLLAHVARHGESYQPNQSPNGLAHRLLGSGDPLVWQPAALAPYHPAVHAATLASAGLLAFVALAWRRRDAPHAELEDLCAAALAATLAAPIAWEHHYGIALPIFAVALPRMLATPGLGAGSVAALAFAYALVSHDVAALDALAAGPASPLASYVLFGGLLLLALCLRLRRARHAAALASA